jgi:hypothetical protein
MRGNLQRFKYTDRHFGGSRMQTNAGINGIVGTGEYVDGGANHCSQTISPTSVNKRRVYSVGTATPSAGGDYHYHASSPCKGVVPVGDDWLHCRRQLPIRRLNDSCGAFNGSGLKARRSGGPGLRRLGLGG